MNQSCEAHHSACPLHSRRSDNVIGWIYGLIAFVFAAGEFAGSYASRPLPGRVWMALLPT